MVNTPNAGIALRDLHVGAYNPRHYMDPNEYAELMASIAAQGVLQPILVRPVAGKKTPYEIVAGQRRFLASLEVFGQDYVIPVLEKVMTDEQAEAASATENIDRAQMSPAEEAEAAARVLARCNGDRAEAAKRLGWSPANLANRLKLMACSELVRQRLSERKISLGLAEMLSGMTTAKQDELLVQFDKSGVPTIDDAKAMVMALTKSLPEAIFDRAECGACAHNSARQSSMFGNIDEGHCLNASCYDLKTEGRLEETVKELVDDYQRVEIVRPGDNFRVVPIKPESVGAEQAQACHGCKDFGAAVSGLPNKLGKVSRGLCWGLSCNEEKVAAFKAAQEALKAPPVTTDAAPSASETKVSPDGKAAKAAPAAKTTKATPAPATPPSIGLSNAVLEFRDELYRKVIYKEFATSPAFHARFVMAIVLNNQGRLFNGGQIRDSFTKNGWIGEGNNTLSLVESMKVMLSLEQDKALGMLPKLGATTLKDLQRSELKGLAELTQADLAGYFVLNDESGKKLLTSLTKAEIIAICDEVGISEKMGKTFRSISGGKKDEFIKQITSIADFDYAGKVPRVLIPSFEK